MQLTDYNFGWGNLDTGRIEFTLELSQHELAKRQRQYLKDREAAIAQSILRYYHVKPEHRK